MAFSAVANDIPDRLTEPKGEHVYLPDPDKLYEDSAATTPASVGGPVGAWEDQSGSHTATQSTTANKPTLRQDANGQFFVEFVPNEDFLETSVTTTSATKASTIPGVGAFSAQTKPGNKSRTNARIQSTTAGAVVKEGSLTDSHRAALANAIDQRGKDVADSVTSFGEYFRDEPLTHYDAHAQDTSGVTEMAFMFDGTSVSDLSPLSGWDTSQVTNMRGMFQNTSVSDLSPLSNWDTSQVTRMDFMFRNTSVSDLSPLSNWDTSQVTRMDFMFDGTSVSDLSPLSGWDTSQVTNMRDMFQNTSVSDLSPLSNWDTSQVTRMDFMFRSTSVSDLSPLSNWDTSQVTNMAVMFQNTSVSDLSPLSNWDTSQVTNMAVMFRNTSVSDPSTISGWDVANVTDFTSFLEGAPLDSAKTGDMLDGWTDGSPNTAADLQTGVTLGIQNADFSQMDTGGQDAVNALCSNQSWTINATNAPADCS
nr:BspA family leucine-rich repeat surface protein [Salinibacter ruber]